MEVSRAMGNMKDVRQLVRSSGSVAANWIEAGKALSKKDRLYRMKLCRKEARESRFWLGLVQTNEFSTPKRRRLQSESEELVLIFAILVRRLE